MGFTAALLAAAKQTVPKEERIPGEQWVSAEARNCIPGRKKAEPSSYSMPLAVPVISRLHAGMATESSKRQLSFEGSRHEATA